MLLQIGEVNAAVQPIVGNDGQVIGHQDDQGNIIIDAADEHGNVVINAADEHGNIVIN